MRERNPKKRESLTIKAANSAAHGAIPGHVAFVSAFAVAIGGPVIAMSAIVKAR